jgi:ubiquitin C-terminal hydrolase
MQFGLTNNSNTCYINSVLQLLIDIKPLRKYITKFTNNIELDKSVLLSFSKIIKYYDINKDDNIVVNPKSFLLEVFKQFHFKESRQEDAHEFLYCFIDYLHEALKVKNVKNVNKYNKEWKKYCKNNYSIITKLFYGQLRSKIYCECGESSISYSPFCGMTISSDYENIQKGIENYLTGDIVETTCDKCKINSLKNIQKNMEIIPKYLIVQVSRFNNNLTKSSNPIDYTSDININNQKFTLVGNIYHAGQINFGHYLCSVKDEDKTTWNIFNDDSINKIESDKINESFFKKQVYILIFKNV